MKFLKRRSDAGVAGRIQMAPMIDVVFQLLIFFLVASEMRPTEAEFMGNLPKDGEGPLNPDAERNEVFRVYLRLADESGAVEVSLNGEALGLDREGFRALAGRLSAIPDKGKALLIIGGDPAIRTQAVTEALDCASEAQLPKVGFAKPRT